MCSPPFVHLSSLSVVLWISAKEQHYVKVILTGCAHVRVMRQKVFLKVKSYQGSFTDKTTELILCSDKGVTYTFSLNFLLKCIQGRRHYRFTEFACACNVHSTPHSRLYVPSEKKAKEEKSWSQPIHFLAFYLIFNLNTLILTITLLSLCCTWNAYFLRCLND